MLGTRLRATGRSVVAILSAVCFLAMSLGSVTRAVATEDVFETWPKKPADSGVAPKPVPGANGAGKAWETWPPKKSEPGVPLKPDTDAIQAAKAGEAEEKKTAKGKSSGTNWWIAAGAAVVIGIGIAIAAGGGGGGGSTTTNPGHQ